MVQRRHHRRRTAYLRKREQRKRVLRPIIGLLVLAALLFGTGRWVLNRFGVGNTIQRTGTTLSLEGTALVNASIDGGELKRAEDGQKLYPGDRAVTSAGAHAVLTFFEGSTMRMDELTDVIVTENYEGETTSDITLRLQEGALYVRTPEKSAFSGAIVRQVVTPEMTMNIPSAAETLIQSRSIVVYSADGIGVTIKPKNGLLPVIVGEGQKFTLPPEVTADTDLYTYRSPLDPLAVQSPFVKESRSEVSIVTEDESGDAVSSEPTSQTEALIVSAPENGVQVDTSTVEVRGTVSDQVDRIRINGYNAPINETSRNFSLELALPDEDEIDITIVAYDRNGAELAEVRRHIERDREPPESPTITSPAETGEIYRTSRERLEIIGQAPADAIGIIVNDYRLQLFQPGDRTWSYLASTNIDNFKPGENIYRVYAINAGGYRSEPAEITIILGGGPEGVVSEDAASSLPAASAQSSEAPLSLPNNDPLQPGSLSVTAPTAGTSHTAQEASFLIEGTTSADTASLWVNNYRLRLYEAGKTNWNYIADVNLNTLSRGTNTYNVVARGEDGRILDRITYTVEFTPGR